MCKSHSVSFCFFSIRRPPRSTRTDTLFPYTTLFRSNSMRVDGFEKEIDLVGTLTVTDDGIEVDFTGTSGASTYGINVPLTYTQAYASFGVRCVIGGAVPNNAGSPGAVRVTAPAGTTLQIGRASCRGRGCRYV